MALQVAAVGAPLQEMVTIPANPGPGASCSAYCAVCPADTAALVEPVGATDSWNANANVPERETECGEFGASSVITNEAVRLPCVLGVKFTVITQLDCTATGAVRHALVCEKSDGFEPLNAIADTCNTAVPELVN